MPKILENTYESILEKAEEILYEEGYNSISIRRIAKECNISIGTIYNYFSNKEMLIQKIIMNYWERFYEVFDKIAEEDTDFFIKLREIFYEFKIFFEKFSGIWVKVNRDIIDYYSNQKYESKKDFMTKLTSKMEKLINKSIDHEIEDNRVISKFVIMNFTAMSQMEYFDYDTFETILKKLLR